MPATAGPFSILTALAVFVAPAPCVTGQVAFVDLGVLGGGWWSAGRAVNADGTAAAGSASAGGYYHAFRWTKSGGMEDLGALPSSEISSATAISADGLFVVGGCSTSSGYRAFRWTTDGMQDLGILPNGTFSEATGVSADGTVVTGTSGTRTNNGFRAFRWSLGTGMENLGVLPGADSSEGRGLSADGSVVVGGSGGHAFRWTSSGGMEDLGVVTGDVQSSCTMCSADGLAALGFGSRSGAESRPIRWTAEEGMHTLGLSPLLSWQLHGLSAHGTVIVGSDEPTEPKRAIVWTRALGAVYLRDLLIAADIDLTGWVLQAGYGVSYDGSAIVGTGTLNGPDNYRAFLVTGLFKKADYNHDGFVDGIDYDQFMNDYETADPAVQIRADVNFDWVVDGLDYDQFNTDFVAGR